MKKISIVIFALLCVLMISGCKKKNKIPKSLTLNENNIVLEIGDTYEVKATVQGLENYTLVLEDPNQLIEINGTVIKALKQGTTSVKVKVQEDSTLVATLNLTINELLTPSISMIERVVNLTVGDSYEFKPIVANLEKYTLKLEQSSNLLQVDGLNVKALNEGITTVTISVVENPELKVTVEVKVIRPFIPTLTIENKNIALKVGDNYELKPQTNVEGDDLYIFTLDKTNIIKLDGLNVRALASGTVTIKVALKAYPDVYVEVKVNVTEKPDTINPEFIHNYPEVTTLSWGKNINLSEGIRAIDDVDQDITENIVISTGTFDNKTLGKYTIIYQVSDKAGNTTKYERTIEVIWDYTVQFIGHSGSYYGVANSEQAFLVAARDLKYQLIECDLKQTKDGVFVMCHDDTFGGKTLASTDWIDIKDVEVTSSRTAGYPSQYGETVGKYTSKICTLERYLEICKEYGCIALIELKSSPGINNSDTSRMQALMDEIEKAGMLNQVAFLGSVYKCLEWVKASKYSYIPCQYLVNSCENEDVLNRCIKYGFELSINVTGNYSNSADWIARYQEAGIKVSTWTFTQYIDYKEIQKWIDLGVDYVTTDWHRMDKVQLTRLEDIKTHKVIFKDADGTELKTIQVRDGRGAPAPQVTPELGYKFVGWDKEITNITEDLVVTAKYELINYSIEYIDNLYTFSESTWATKEEFVNEFYNDLFNWLKDNVDDIEWLTYSNNQYTLKRNSSTNGTAVFSSAADIRALDVYVFESSISSLIYKPIEGTNSADYKPVVDNNYFLNSEPYRTKYQNMNAYLINAITNGYPAYSKEFKQQSNNRVQIFFRFHQWCNGNGISAFNNYPSKFTVKYMTGVNVTMPSSPLTYTILDEITLPNPTTDIEFLGWYLDINDESTKIEKINLGSTGNVVVYAKWGKVSIPDVYSKINYVLNGGTNSENNPSEYLEGLSQVIYNPTRKGYEFMGWSTDLDGKNIVTMISERESGDITLYANWEYDKYTISYDLGEGSWGNEIQYNGTPVTNINSTAKTDFWNQYTNNVFLFNKTGGFTNATFAYRIGIVVDKNSGAYKVNKIGESGETGESFSTAGLDYLIVISASHANYGSFSNFMSKVEVGMFVKFTGDPDSGIATIDFYKSTDVSGTSIENYVSEYTIANFQILLPTPKCEGKVFKGWSLSKTDTTNVFTSLPTDLAQNVTLYAIFE